MQSCNSTKSPTTKDQKAECSIGKIYTGIVIKYVLCAEGNGFIRISGTCPISSVFIQMFCGLGCMDGGTEILKYRGTLANFFLELDLGFFHGMPGVNLPHLCFWPGMHGWGTKSLKYRGTLPNFFLI
jgi:hypothetical protein